MINNCKMEEKKKNNMTELSDADFLSFLYSERDREESLTTYQGWNLWAIAGALITVICVGYGIICAHAEDLDWLRTSYFLSGFLGVFFCYRYLALFVMSFWARKRGVDYQKIRFLRDVAPIPYLVVVTICSVGSAIYFPIADELNRWNFVSVSWIIVSISYILAGINVYINRDGVVQSYIDGLMFTKVRYEIWADTAMSFVFSVIWQRSFKAITRPVIGSPDFEIAVCITSIVFLFYMLFSIQTSQNKTSHIDVLLDDYIYKGRSKESVYQFLRAKRMGYGVLEACSKELLQISALMNEHGKDEKMLDEILSSLQRGDCIIRQYYLFKQQAQTSLDHQLKIIKLSKQLSAKMAKIMDIVPNMKDVSEFAAILKKNEEIYASVDGVASKMRNALNMIETRVEELRQNINEECQMEDSRVKSHKKKSGTKRKKKK